MISKNFSSALKIYKNNNACKSNLKGILVRLDKPFLEIIPQSATEIHYLKK